MPARIDPAAFARRDPAAVVATLAGATMGTGWTVRYAAPRDYDQRVVRTAIETRLDELIAQTSHWHAHSAVVRFNHASPGEWFAVPPDLATVLNTADAVASASGGAFDPAIGCLTDLYGFGPRGATPVPTAADIAAALSVSGWRRLAWDRDGRRLRQPGGVRLDLSGIAKGYAVDAIADCLAALGFEDCLVEIGGELVGRGIRPDGEPWWVDIETPPGTSLPPLRIALHGLAVATSGSYVKGEHTIDPRNGQPVPRTVASATVVAGTAMVADAHATALMVEGPGPAGMSTKGLAARVILTDDGIAREAFTAAFAALL